MDKKCIKHSDTNIVNLGRYEWCPQCLCELQTVEFVYEMLRISEEKARLEGKRFVDIKPVEK